MDLAQPGILVGETALARYMTFAIAVPDQVESALNALKVRPVFDNLVVGIGESISSLLKHEITGLRTLHAQAVNGIEIPSSPAAVWCWLRGNDRGELFHRSRELEYALSPGLALIDITDSFQYDQNRDLSGYEDGTENPEGAEAVTAAIVQNAGSGMDGSSFVAVQKWLHDFDSFNAMDIHEQDDAIGRHISNNEEFDEAPDSAHVKRSAQESFDPEAFVLRRSMPWTEGLDGGLMFVAFGKSFDAFEAILNRMLGCDDDICDALFTFTNPVNGAYFWCPPIKNGMLDLSRLGL